MFRRKSLFLSATLLLAAGTCLLIHRTGGISDAGSLVRAYAEHIGTNLWLLFFAIAVLPAFGVPNCPLMIIGGGVAAAVHGSGTTTLVAVLAVATNIAWSYWVAAYPLRSYLWKRIESRTQTRWLANMRGCDVVRATWLLHLTPGVPLFIQTYFPGLHRLNFWKYLSIALPVQITYTALIVFSSGEIFRRVPATFLMAVGFGSLVLIGSAAAVRETGSASQAQE